MVRALNKLDLTVQENSDTVLNCVKDAQAQFRSVVSSVSSWPKELFQSAASDKYGAHRQHPVPERRRNSEFVKLKKKRKLDENEVESQRIDVAALDVEDVVKWTIDARGNAATASTAVTQRKAAPSQQMQTAVELFGSRFQQLFNDLPSSASSSTNSQNLQHYLPIGNHAPSVPLYQYNHGQFWCGQPSHPVVHSQQNYMPQAFAPPSDVYGVSRQFHRLQ